MKKSKILQTSKDLLHRSFNPAKCKTSLKLAGSRLKLLKNKKEVQVRQMKREIAQLLESGQDQTARIRVEHVIREEKMMAAYDLIEIYCELVVARLSIIESQKNCPIDLKEAITSLIFVSPRCGDIPELLDVRKHLTAKYGKDFSAAAIELRPACGVSQMLVEKVSAAAPDLQTKIKILSAIAEENNVKWDSGSTNEEVAVPPSDLLNGTTTFGRESNAPSEPFQVSSPFVQAPSSNDKMHSFPLNSSYQDPKTSVVTENVAPAQASSASTAPQHNERPIGDGRSQSSQGNGWNMEFKDAASAAQAAAESAEHASMAARAAAELSNRDKIIRQNSSELNKLAYDYVPKDDGFESNVNLKPISEERVEGLPPQNNRVQNQQIHGTEKNDLKTPANVHEDGRGDRKKHSWSGFSKLKISTDNEFLDHGVHVTDGYSMKTSSNEESCKEMNIIKKSSKNKAEDANLLPEKLENFREERKGIQPNISDDVNIFWNPDMHMEKQSLKYGANDVTSWPEKSEIEIPERISNKPSLDSLHSHSSISDEENIFSNFKDHEVGYAVEENSFFSFNEGDGHGEASRKSASALFAKYDSDSDYPRFDIGTKYDKQESQFHLPSSSQNSIDSDSCTHAEYCKSVDSPTLFFNRKNSFPEYSEDMSKDNTKVDNFAGVRFDDADGPTFDDDANNLPSEHNRFGSSFKEKRSSGFNQEHFSSSDDELKSEEIHKESRQGKKWDSYSPKNFEKSPIDQPPLGLKKSRIEPKNFSKESEPDSGEGLNFGKLTGGFRHKGNISPPYVKNSSLLKESTSILESPNKGTSSHRKENATPPALEPDSDSDSSDEEVYSQKESGRKQIPLALHTGSEVEPKSHLKVPNSYFISGNSDLDDDVPKESPSTKNLHRTAISRRTKAVSPNPKSGRISYSKRLVTSEAEAGMNKEPTESEVQLYFHEKPTSSKVVSKTVKSNFWGPPDTSQSSKMHDFSGSSERDPKDSSAEIESSRNKFSSKVGSSKPGNSSVFAPPKLISSGKIDSTTATGKSSKSKMESPKAATSSKDDNTTKASHVHPKLPDYDFLVQSLRRS